MIRINNELGAYATNNFDEMFNAKPDTLGAVQVIEDGEYVKKEIFRYFESYGKQVEFDKTTGKSYMFGAGDPTVAHKELPEIFAPLSLLGYGVGASSHYNQCTINWYRAKEDFIEPHADCTAKWVEGSGVVVLNLMRDPDAFADMQIYDYPSRDLLGDVKMGHGFILTMSADDQMSYRHGVGPSPCDRISLTFRNIA